ncbi:TetR/AcrR family transcriptional regulator [Paenibacillus sp. NPDC058910]|uniref:TetR/AcrR family transcriptional regulator n=1 Tax=unclassified Paenibacillus TaxID=185978 RepID=UPI0036BD9D21
MRAAVSANVYAVVVVKVAECVFTHKGIETATMQDVATEAKMGIATIFRFFPRKEKLVVAIATKKLETVLETFRSIAERLRSAFSPESCPSKKNPGGRAGPRARETAGILKQILLNYLRA